MLTANFDHAGSNKFISHLIDDWNPHHTRCGLPLEQLRGQWEMLDNKKQLPSCKNCLRSLKKEGKQ
jgi:hypothetical protein